MSQERYVTIRGGVMDGVVYLRAEDVVHSLRLTADGYRKEAEDDDKFADTFEEVARLFEGEADEYDLIAMQLLAEDVDEEDGCPTDTAGTDSRPILQPPPDPAP